MATVIQAATATQLATLAALKAELSITSDAQDTQLGSYLDQASSLIADFTDRTFPQTVWSETFRLRGQRRRTLCLKHWPVATIVSLTVDQQLIDLTADVLDCDQAGLLHAVPELHGCDDSGWWAHHVVVVYQAGYVLPGQAPSQATGTTIAGEVALPATLTRACLDAAKGLYHSSDRDPLVRSEAEQGIGSTSWLDPQPTAGGLPIGVAASLAGYCRTGLA